jgi:hypothetical protein
MASANCTAGKVAGVVGPAGGFGVTGPVCPNGPAAVAAKPVATGAVVAEVGAMSGSTAAAGVADPSALLRPVTGPPMSGRAAAISAVKFCAELSGTDRACAKAAIVGSGAAFWSSLVGALTVVAAFGAAAFEGGDCSCACNATSKEGSVKPVPADGAVNWVRTTPDVPLVPAARTGVPVVGTGDGRRADATANVTSAECGAVLELGWVGGADAGVGVLATCGGGGGGGAGADAADGATGGNAACTVGWTGGSIGAVSGDAGAFSGFWIGPGAGGTTGAATAVSTNVVLPTSAACAALPATGATGAGFGVAWPAVSGVAARIVAGFVAGTGAAAAGVDPTAAPRSGATSVPGPDGKVDGDAGPVD